MHEICLKSKQKFFDKSIFSFCLKSLQNRSRGLKLILNWTSTSNQPRAGGKFSKKGKKRKSVISKTANKRLRNENERVHADGNVKGRKKKTNNKLQKQPHSAILNKKSAMCYYLIKGRAPKDLPHKAGFKFGQSGP